MLGKRIVSAILGFILLVMIVSMGKLFINIAIAIISIIALHELFSAVEGIDKTPLVWLGYFTAIFITFGSNMSQYLLMPLLYIFIVLLFIIKIIYHNRITLSQITITLFASIYISYFIAHISFTRELAYGNILIWFIFLGAWSTDTFAYFTGTFFGRNKLLPEISPKKTVEGAIGGIIGCGLTFLVFGYIVHIIGNYNIDYANVFILGFVSSFVSELGDLAASSIKRQYGIKDYGKIMPGHGGVLDRFDSILFVAPVVYYFANYFKIIF